MTRFVFESYLALLRTESLMFLGRLRSFRKLVRTERKLETSNCEVLTSEKLCHAMDLACVLYPKRIMCLQRAAATTLLLRWHGLPAEIVIGVQVLPLKSHAWVEVNGAVVNDRPYVAEIYRQLERF